MTHLAFALPLSSSFWLADHFASLSRVSSGALIAAIWQGALLAAAATLALRLIPRIPAAARFAIWFAVFSLVAALPFLGLALQSTVGEPHAPASAWLSLDSRWTLAIAALWAAASLLRALTLAAAALRVRTLSRTATPIELPLTLTSSTSRRAQLCVSTDAQLCASPDVDRPTVIGFFSPKILIPAWLLDKLTPADLEHIVLHEAGHLNRADDWLNLLQKIALVLFPLNPALAWVERRLCFERELACDERVLSILAARDSAATAYASSLATLAEYRLQHRGAVRAAAQNLALALGALGASARESELGHRVARILRPTARMKPLHVRLATVTAIAALLFATTELEHTPQLVAFTSPASMPEFASIASPHPALLPGYRAVAASLTIPPAASAQAIRATASASTVPQPRTTEHQVPDTSGLRADEARAVDVRASRAQQPAKPRMIATRQPETQPELVITRWAVFQSSDGYRVVRTSTVFSDGPAPQGTSQDDVGSPQHQDQAQPTHARSPRAQQLSQPISPYAAVPVPGGWLVFQL